MAWPSKWPTGQKVCFLLFIFGILLTIEGWVSNRDLNYYSMAKEFINTPNFASALVESCVALHFGRHYPTYYIKAEGEVDVVYVKDHKFWPVEVKWTNQIRSKDLKQIKKYKNSKVYAKIQEPSTISGVQFEPLPLALLKIG